MQRLCSDCGHTEIVHWEQHCFRKVTRFSDDFCPCLGFTARERTEDEIRIAKELRDERLKRSSKPEYIGEAWLDEFVGDFKKRRIRDLDD
jgi:hypothetical protein